MLYVLGHEVILKGQINELATTLSKKEIAQLITMKVDDNEALGKNQFDGLHDIAIIAHYLTKEKHIQSDRNLSEHTLTTYTKVITTFYNDLHEYKDEIGVDITAPVFLEDGEFSMLRSIQRRHVRRYIDWFIQDSPYAQRNGGYKLSSISQKVTILKSFLKQLYIWGIVQMPLHEDLKSTNLSLEDRPNRDAGATHALYLLRLFERVENIPMFCLVHFLTTTGIRNNELCNLKVGNIEYDHIHNGYTMRIIAKGNKQRVIPLKEKTMRSINLFRYVRGLSKIDILNKKKLNPNEPVFTTNRGTAFTSSYLVNFMKRNIEQLPDKERTALDEMFSYTEHENPQDKNSPLIKKQMVITPHLFRHAFAIISSKVENADIYSISRSLGHANIATTRIYLEKVYEAEDNIIHKWDSTVFGEYI